MLAGLSEGTVPVRDLGPGTTS